MNIALTLHIVSIYFFPSHATSIPQDGDNLFDNWSLCLFLKMMTIVQIAILCIICTIWVTMIQKGKSTDQMWQEQDKTEAG